MLGRETALYHQAGHYYDAAGGRYLSPQSYRSGVNGIYTFANNTPVDRSTGIMNQTLNSVMPSGWSVFKEEFSARSQFVNTVKIVGGTVSIGIGAAICTTGIGCVLGAPMMLLGADSIQAGAVGMYYRQNVNTLVHRGAAALASSAGYDAQTADRIGAGVDFAANIVAGGFAGAGRKFATLAAEATAQGVALSTSAALKAGAVHGLKSMAVETAGVGIGGAIGGASGYASDGRFNWDRAMLGASVGLIGGSLAAARWTCFVPGTEVWVPIDDEATLVAAGLRTAEEDQTATTNSWFTFLAASSVSIALLGFALGQAYSGKDEKDRQKASLRDLLFEDDLDWLDDEDDSIWDRPEDSLALLPRRLT